MASYTIPTLYPSEVSELSNHKYLENFEDRRSLRNMVTRFNILSLANAGVIRENYEKKN